jgi:hypothetical protein
MIILKKYRRRVFMPFCILNLLLLPNLTFSQYVNEQELAKSLQEAVNNSPIIIEAQVISKDTSRSVKGTYTLIKFKIIQIIKGAVESNEFTFDQPTYASNSKAYNLNERAIYFIENKNLTGYLQEGRAVIQNGLIDMCSERVDVDFFIKVIKKSITDVLVFPRFADMLTKMREAREEHKVHPHKGIVIPNPLDDIKDTVKVDSTRTPNTTQLHMLHRVPRPKDGMKDSVKQGNNNTTDEGLK